MTKEAVLGEVFEPDGPGGQPAGREVFEEAVAAGVALRVRRPPGPVSVRRKGRLQTRRWTTKAVSAANASR